MNRRFKSQKSKFYLKIIITSIVILLAFIYLNYLFHQSKFNNRNSKLLNNILKSRNLKEADENFEKICAKSHENLREYYSTGNLDKIDGVDEDISFEDDDKDKIHIKSLMNIIKLITNNDNEENKNKFDNDSIKDDMKTYFNHNVSVLFFIVIGALATAAWILSIICSFPYFNFACCCCLKKEDYQTYFIISIFILYLLSFSLSLYGLIKTNKISTDLADMECSIYKFFEQSLDGEGKETYPKWIGLNKINATLNELYIKIEELEEKTLNDLRQKIDNINNKKINFKNKMKETGNEFYTSSDSNIYSNLYSNEYDIDSRGISGRYVLDIIKMFGKQVTDINEEKYEPENSTLDLWHNEYKLISQKADDYFEEAVIDLQIISDKNQNFKKIIENMSILKKFFINFYENIEYSLIENSKFLNINGKTILNILFSFLFCFIIFLIILMIVFLCSSDYDKNNDDCCSIFIFKWSIHIVANILYLFMIFSFLLGNFLMFIGDIGNDFIISYSIILDKNNFGDSRNKIFDHLGNAKDYLNAYINGNEDLFNLLNISSNQTSSFKNIETLEVKLNETINEFEGLKNFKAYYHCEEELESRLNLSTIPILIKDTHQISIPLDEEQLYGTQTDKYLKFDYELELMNTIIRAQNAESNLKEQWKLNSGSSNKCDSGIDPMFNSLEFNPLNCRPLDRDWIQNTACNSLKKQATIVSDILIFLDNANNNFEHKSLIYILNDLKNEYNEYIDLYLNTSIEFKYILNEISSLLQYNNNEDDNILSFINGKIIGTNLKIITKYIKSVIGKDVKTMGICTIVIGFSLGLSLPFTILIIIISTEKLNKKKNHTDNEYINNNRPITATSYRHITYSPTPSINSKSNAYSYIKEAKQFLIKGCNLPEEIFDKTYDRQGGWRRNKSGPRGYLKPYYPPKKLTGIGLKVALLYDGEDIGRNWLGNNNNKGEWYIAYHGVKSIASIQKICEEGFRRGDGQVHKNDKNINPLTQKKYPLCGEGVYFSNDIDEVKTKYAKSIFYKGNEYKIIFMCRVNPYEVRIAKIGKNKEYWIVEGDKLGDLYGKKRSDLVRPYRILMYKVK